MEFDGRFRFYFVFVSRISTEFSNENQSIMTDGKNLSENERQNLSKTKKNIAQMNNQNEIKNEDKKSKVRECR